MATGAVFTLISNQGKQDKIFTDTHKLRDRLIEMINDHDHGNPCVIH